MRENEIESLEITLILDAIYSRYGYDFRDYARASMERRVKHYQKKSGYKSISEMIPRLLHDETFFQSLIHEFSITVTEMFRDPGEYRVIKEKVIPILKTYPYIKVWHAGCATGEEVYSLAILLEEAGLYKKTTIFATDFNDEVLETARQGIYKLDNIQQCTKNYQQSGGSESFSQYYHAKYESIVMDKSLKKNITFANHNLASDFTFSEMNLILCRNVMIYFNANLQNRALNLFDDSLLQGGFLCLGNKESLMFWDGNKKYHAVEGNSKIYRKLYLQEELSKLSR
ncbi:MAG: protein-glutamate O-methyltransferase CheR [Candidatus Stygibacter australis]|nr:protein-glutamate O-methyltransferase CheR [Candidatus Stygibacter australis]MDP8321106.1 protein-glutamate O-methyltransferase CheR [Candidatus Stygibacter australis]